MRRIVILAVASALAEAQVPKGTAAQSSGPPVGTASVRLEDWGQMRTAAWPVLGWRVGVATASFRTLTFWDAAARADALGVANVQGSSAQKLSLEIPKHLDFNLAPGEQRAVRDRLRALNLRMPVYVTSSIGAGEAAIRKLFEFAKALGVEVIVASSAPDSLPDVDRLANEFAISVALPHAGIMPQALEGRSKRIGIRADTGYWIEQGIKPLDGLAQLKDRLIVLNLRDVALARGAGGLPEFLRELYRLGLKPALITVDAAGGADTSAELRQSLSGFEDALRPLLAERVGQMARSSEIRGPGRLTAEERARVEEALPRQAPAKPKQARKLLVMDVQIAYGGHRSIPAVNLALEQMGKITGAYEAVFNNDLDNLKYPAIKQYDAVFLNNTVGMIFVDPDVREGMVRFVREGGGLAGIHGTSHASMDWTELSEMTGAWRGVHREATEQATVKIEDPGSPLTAAFGGKEFVYQDEFFRFPVGPYSREKLRVLLSIDVEKTDMNQGLPCAQPCARADNDYAISWIRSYGKGRVFFSTLGHNPTLFTTPPLAAHFLAAIQFILGDLEADTTPSAKAATAASQPRQLPRARHTADEMEPLLARIAAYECGADPDPVISFGELVEDLLGAVEEPARTTEPRRPAGPVRASERRRTLEARLLRFLQSDATAAGKEVAFRQLSLVGTDASVAVLAPMLVRAETAEPARFALAAIPGAAADEALRKSLGGAPNDRIKTGIVNSLGERRDEKAVPLLAGLVSPGNPGITAAAAAALGNIGSREALDALAAARKKAGPAREFVSEGYLACADRTAERGDKAAAIAVYRQMLAPGEPRRLRTRALTGLTRVNSKAAVPVLTAEIDSKDREMQAAAVKLLSSIPGTEITNAMAGKYPKLPPSGQVQLLTALAAREDTAAKPTILAALKSTSPAVRAAALAGLGRLGDESSVPVLAEAAASGQALEQAAARRSLYSLRGPGIDKALIAAMGSSAGKVKTELITAAGERGAAGAADALAKAAQESDPEVRRAALLALRNVGGTGQTAALLDLLLQARSASERRAVTQTLGTVLRRAQPAPISGVIAAYHAQAQLSVRLSLLDVMGQVSSQEALELLRRDIRDQNPEIARGAILALTAWDNSTPLMDLLEFARTAPRNLEAKGTEAEGGEAGPAGGRSGRRGVSQATNNLRVLALRGVLKLILLEPRRPAPESGRLLAEAMGLASQRAEKFAVLSLLQSFPCQESLGVARAALGDAEVANEAKVALAQVTEALRPR
jgi:type 1 glutamine amidotransferase/HEAT repeat protein/sugar phosphate isomerase/epimerase